MPIIDEFIPGASWSHGGTFPGLNPTPGPENTAVDYEWMPLDEPPELPDSLPTPQADDPLEPTSWHQLTTPMATLYVAFTGDGGARGLAVGWLYVVPAEGQPLRFPTLEEIYSSAAQGPVDGILWELPMFAGDPEPEARLDAPEALVLHYRQRGAVQGSDAESRIRLTGALDGSSPAHREGRPPRRPGQKQGRH